MKNASTPRPPTKVEKLVKSSWFRLSAILTILGMAVCPFFVYNVMVEGHAEAMVNTETAKVISVMGTIGDSYGFVNTLYSGLAFLALIITLLIQAYQLHLQMIELHETRDVMKQQEEEMNRQNTVLEEQSIQMKISADIQAKAILMPYLQKKLDEVRDSLDRTNEEIPLIQEEIKKSITSTHRDKCKMRLGLLREEKQKLEPLVEHFESKVEELGKDLVQYLRKS